MRYMGGKSRIGKKLVEAMGANERPSDQLYFEPFMGACGVAMHVRGPKLLADANPYMVAFWRRIRDGWVPPTEMPEERWREIRENQDAHPPELVAFAAVGCAFGGTWWGGYARGKGRDFPAEASRSAVRRAKGLQGAGIECATYDELEIPPGSLVYCDPPYAGTSAQSQWGSFDSDAFWGWAAELGKTCDVYVSEAAAPAEVADLVWEKEVRRDLKSKGSKTRAERLYRVRR